MVVNSLNFLLFFIVVFTVYYLPGIRQYAVRQNVWLLLTSYFFYGFVDWKMLPILLGVTVLFYWLGKQVKNSLDEGNKKKASHFQNAGVVIGVGLLLYFKYLNFFAESVADLLNQLGLHVSWTTLNIVLPVGVSFFTFKLISYVIEIKRKKTQPAESLLEFATYISFFPTILSGPIDRPTAFLPQLRKNHDFKYDKAVDGCRQILWGMFTKMCIADNLASTTTVAWSSFESCTSQQLLYAALLSPIQVYADFDGYSNMAIGVGKILGFDIIKNFNHPLLARNVSEYWNRWHMSLTSWITDYVFTPLSLKFRDWRMYGIYLAITINLVLIGLWHGANWTYAVFGIYHSLLFIPLIVTGSFAKIRKIKSNSHGLPFLKDVANMILTYLLIAIGHIIFFAKDVKSAFAYFQSLLNFNGYTSLRLDSMGQKYIIYLFILVLIIVEWISRNKEHGLSFGNSKIVKSETFRLLVYALLFLLCITMSGKHSDFIYFKF